MSSPRDIVCTDKGQHGRLSITTLDFTEGDCQVTVRERGVRHKPFPKTDGTIVVDGESYAAPARLMVSADSTQVEGFPDRWRWQCPKCGRDRPMTTINLLRWYDATPDGSVLDISLLPR